MARITKSTTVQTVLFDKAKWTVSSAKRWLKRHKYKVPEVDTTKEYHRFRQYPPFQFQKGTFRTIVFGAKNKGIKAVIAVPRTVKNPKTISPKKKKEIPSSTHPDIRKLKPPREVPPKRKPGPWPPRKLKRNPKSSAKKPWLPTVLVDLATPISIDLEGGEELRFPRSGNYALGSNRSGTELWIVSRRGGKKIRATDEKGEKLYETFTGFEHDDIAKMVQIRPRSMMRLGRAMNIVYRSDKFSKPGDTSDYVHPFQHYPTVSVDNLSQPTIVALRGGRIKVRKEGITG